MELSAELIHFVKESVRRGDGDVGPDDSLIDLGLIDSVGLMQLMSFIGDRTGRRVPDHYVTPDNFRTATAMVGMLQELEPISR